MANTSEFKKKCSKIKTAKKECKNNKLVLNLASISYTEYVILASVLAYSFVEDLDEDDLDMLISFISMVLSNIAILRTKEGILNKNINLEENIILEEIEDVDITPIALYSREPKKTKIKKIKKIRKKIKKK